MFGILTPLCWHFDPLSEFPNRAPALKIEPRSKNLSLNRATTIPRTDFGQALSQKDRANARPTTCN